MINVGGEIENPAWVDGAVEYCLDRVPARAYEPELIKAVLNGSINPGRVFDSTTDIDHIADAYAAMDERRAIKALVTVSSLKGST